MSQCCCLFLDTDFTKVQKVQDQEATPKATQYYDYALWKLVVYGSVINAYKEF